MIISSQSLIELAFQRGAFDLSATSKTTQAFIFYATGLVFFALRDYLMNCFYALKKTKVAMYSCITAVILNVGLSIYLSKYLSAGGIALASSISMLSQSIFLAVYLWRQTNPSKAFNKVFFTDILKFCGTFILVYITALAFHPSVKGFPNLLRLTVLSSIVFTSFFVYAFILKIREIQLVSRFIKRG
jgi:putative peptidoglycan lipid II flippase